MSRIVAARISVSTPRAPAPAQSPTAAVERSVTQPLLHTGEVVQVVGVNRVAAAFDLANDGNRGRPVNDCGCDVELAIPSRRVHLQPGKVRQHGCNARPILRRTASAAMRLTSGVLTGC